MTWSRLPICSARPGIVQYVARRSPQRLHVGGFVAARGAQEQRFDEGRIAGGNVRGFERLPKVANFVVVKDAIAGALFRFGASHAANDRAGKFIVPHRLPVEGFADMGKRPIGHDRAGLVGHLVEHLHDVPAPHVINRHFSDVGTDVGVQRVLHLIGAPELAGVALGEVVENGVDGVFSGALGFSRLGALGALLLKRVAS